jgi:hypothetical protein
MGRVVSGIWLLLEMDCLQNRLLYGALQGVSWGVLLVVGSAQAAPPLGAVAGLWCLLGQMAFKKRAGVVKRGNGLSACDCCGRLSVPSCHDPEGGPAGDRAASSIFLYFMRRSGRSFTAEVDDLEQEDRGDDPDYH